nr:uncharacterized protein LOC103351456 isoform X3 [Oryctolagus cuniculus]
MVLDNEPKKQNNNPLPSHTLRGKRPESLRGAACSAVGGEPVPAALGWTRRTRRTRPRSARRPPCPPARGPARSGRGFQVVPEHSGILAVFTTVAVVAERYFAKLNNSYYY